MKTIRHCLAPLALVSALCFVLMPLAIVGCNSNSTALASPTASPTPTAASFVTPASVQLGAQLATSSALSFGVQDSAQRKVLADHSYSAARALRSLATGSATTPKDVEAAVQQFGGPGVPVAYQALAGDLGALYAQFYPALAAHKDAALTASYLEALASGVEAGVLPYE